MDTPGRGLTGEARHWQRPCFLSLWPGGGDGAASGPQRPPGVGADRMVDNCRHARIGRNAHVAPHRLKIEAGRRSSISKRFRLRPNCPGRGPTPFAPRTPPAFRPQVHGLDRISQRYAFPGGLTSGTVRG